MSSINSGAYLFSASISLTLLYKYLSKQKVARNTTESNAMPNVMPIAKLDIEDDAETESTTVSASGKALIAGGYLVLENPNVGVTVASTSRFYSTVKILVGDEHVL
jgi:hypothetical protein